MRRILIDAMGGDNAPGEIVSGALQALGSVPDISIALIGQKDAIDGCLQGKDYPSGRLSIVPASEVISTEEVPVSAVRKKKDSSLVVGMRMLKNGEGDALVSAGSTGAVLAAGSLIVRTIKGVHRPAIGMVLPGEQEPFMLIDCGANVDSKPIMLEQFALMGAIYMEKLMRRKDPRIGLINIGVEEEKGNELTKRVYQDMKTLPLNFAGNVEARDICAGAADVLVCDGFTGNVILKFMEGFAGAMFSLLKKELTATPVSSLLALGLKKNFKAIKTKMDYAEYGGAPLLGLEKCVIKAHGSSNARAIENAVRQAAAFADGDLCGLIREGIEKNGMAFVRGAE